MKNRNAKLATSIAAISMTATMLVASVPAAAPAATGPGEMCRTAPASAVDRMLAGAYPAQARHAAYNQDLDMRDDTGYNTAYLFAMTKAVASGPVTPALKPLLFLFTVPLDIITLPFTAIAGFF
jgi:hypothetical protein